MDPESATDTTSTPSQSSPGAEALEAMRWERIALRVVKIFAWVWLVAGVGASVFFLVRAITLSSSYGDWSYYPGLDSATNLVRDAAFVAAGLLLIAALGAWAFSLVFASIAESLIILRKKQ